MTGTMHDWDKVAPDYQRVYRLGLNDYNTRLLRFWEESGMLFPGARVLDIGCGVGKYGTYLAALGYDVTLTDISGEMLCRASENMAKYSAPWAVYRCDFHEVTGREAVFADGFDEETGEYQFRRVMVNTWVRNGSVEPDPAGY